MSFSPLNLSIRRRECKKGFWLPDEICRLLITEGSAALMFYCFLGQYETLQEYPTASHLAALMNLETHEVWELIERLHDLGILNDSDVKVIFRKSEEEP